MYKKIINVNMYKMFFYMNEDIFMIISVYD